MTPYRSIKLLVYWVSKRLGIFRLTRYFTRNGLRILCYHGVSVADGYQWRPMLFMRAETFQERMSTLRRMGLPVLTLEEGVDRLERDELPACATVITIDDGFFHTAETALPILDKLDLPATLYVTSYYVEKQTPIFWLAVQYMFWKSARTDFALSELDMDDLQDSGNRPIDRQIRSYGEGLDEPGRVKLCEKLARCLDVDYQGLTQSKLLSLMSGEQIRRASDNGLDIQLHTQRHLFPEDRSQALSELRENTEDLKPYVDQPMTHFCYPKGICKPAHLPILEEAGIKSATTTEAGLNYSGHNCLLLGRWLDSDEFTGLEFEAELSGFIDVLRRVRSRLLRTSPAIARRPG